MDIRGVQTHFVQVRINSLSSRFGRHTCLHQVRTFGKKLTRSLCTLSGRCRVKVGPPGLRLLPICRDLGLRPRRHPCPCTRGSRPHCILVAPVLSFFSIPTFFTWGLSTTSKTKGAQGVALQQCSNSLKRVKEADP